MRRTIINITPTTKERLHKFRDEWFEQPDKITDELLINKMIKYLEEYFEQEEGQ